MDTIAHISLNNTIKHIKDKAGQEMLAPEELSLTSAHAYSAGDLFRYNGKLYKVINPIAIDDAITINTNCIEVTIAEELAEKVEKVSNATSGNFASLDNNGNLVDSGHKHTDYLTSHQAIPVTDVQVNGTSIVSSGVANVPLANTLVPGVARVDASYGISIGTAGLVAVVSASSNQAKLGTETYKPITPSVQNASTFYGLAKAAGDTTQASSSNPVGTYTDNAKSAIRNMIGAAAQSDIPSIPVQDVQINETSILSSGVANVPLASASTFGVIKQGIGLYFNPLEKKMEVAFADTAILKAATRSDCTTAPYRQHIATFYGLAKAAGDTTQSQSSNSVGTYTDSAKTAIRSMLGATSPDVIAVQDATPTSSDTKIWIAETAPSTVTVPTVAEMESALSEKVDDVQINGTSVISNGIANIPVASQSAPGVVMVDQSYGIIIHPTLGYLAVNQATDNDIKAGTVGQKPIVPYLQHAAAFYGLAKAAGDTTQSASSNAVGTYTDSAKSAIRSMIGAASSSDIPSVPVQDVQVNGTSVLSSGVANVPLAICTSNSQTPGVVKVGYYTYGLYIAGGELRLNIGYEGTIKSNGSGAFAPINMQHAMAFYGLARAAGDTTQSQSNNAIGNYTNEAKAAIQTMLGVENGISFIETISDTDVTISGEPNTRYMCGEVSTISITPPNAGIISVTFTSGTSATILSLPNTVKLPAWFDKTDLETDTTYEIIITDGIYGSVMTWQN